LVGSDGVVGLPEAADFDGEGVIVIDGAAKEVLVFRCLASRKKVHSLILVVVGVDRLIGRA
jgi:hypothetical protein